MTRESIRVLQEREAIAKNPFRGYENPRVAHGGYIHDERHLLESVTLAELGVHGVAHGVVDAAVRELLIEDKNGKRRWVREVLGVLPRLEQEEKPSDFGVYPEERRMEAVESTLRDAEARRKTTRLPSRRPMAFYPLSDEFAVRIAHALTKRKGTDYIPWTVPNHEGVRRKK